MVVITGAGQVPGLSEIFQSKMELSLGDIAAVVIYFLLILGIGFWVGDTILLHCEDFFNHLPCCDISVSGPATPWDSGGIFPGWEVHVLAPCGRLSLCWQHW